MCVFCYVPFANRTLSTPGEPLCGAVPVERVEAREAHDLVSCFVLLEANLARRLVLVGVGADPPCVR